MPHLQKVSKFPSAFYLFAYHYRRKAHHANFLSRQEAFEQALRLWLTMDEAVRREWQDRIDACLDGCGKIKREKASNYRAWFFQRRSKKQQFAIGDK